jgi:hypothetical protein
MLGKNILDSSETLMVGSPALIIYPAVLIFYDNVSLLKGEAEG